MRTGVSNRERKKLVIVGGGTAGRLAAAALANRLTPDRYEITVIESAHVGSISVGESLVPHVVRFFRDLGVSEKEFVASTKANYKLGIQFNDWLEKGSSFFQPFGRLGKTYNGYGFFQCWLKARSEGDRSALTDYSPAAALARHQKFAHPDTIIPGSPLDGMDYAFQLDAKNIQHYLREYAEQRNVRHVQAHVVSVNLAEGGDIQSVELNNRQTVAGDFFIDCSGTRGMLIDEALDSPFTSWQELLPCDRAVAMQSENYGRPLLNSTFTAGKHGWIWGIPLKERTSNGMVFCSGQCSDNEAMEVLESVVGSGQTTDPLFIPLRQGARKYQWIKNCIAIGQSGGLLEPLESSSIYLITRGVQLMLELFPDLWAEERSWPSLATQFNTRMSIEYESIRDFIILHYVTSQRSDTDFWRSCRSLEIPESIVSRLELFKERGELGVFEHGLFTDANWQVLLTGMKIIPRSYHPFLDLSDFREVQQAMKRDRDRIEATAEEV